jgi:hypothetical protein
MSHAGVDKQGGRRSSIGPGDVDRLEGGGSEQVNCEMTRS